jgi:hypothetical protein
MKPVSKNIGSRESWIIENDQVELALTKGGGHMAPVTFYKHTKNPIQPYFINPWHDEDIKISIPVLGPLRGDFFCMPFGEDNRYRDEDHTVHGEPAAGTWDLEGVERSGRISSLELLMQTSIRRGKVTKRIALHEGHNAVYLEHTLSGYSGKMNFGHHATLSADYPEDAMKISVSPFEFGMVAPADELLHSDGEYYSLLKGSRFKKLEKVPTVWKKPAFENCSLYPRREGFDDIIALMRKDSGHTAWQAVSLTSEGYIWYALKDPSVLPSTVFWMENRGRHGKPWRGRTRCIGIEDTLGFFAGGLKPAAQKNQLNEEGIETSRTLSKRKPTVIRYIQGVVRAPKSFHFVKKVLFTEEGLVFISDGGKEVKAKVDHNFLYSGAFKDQ